MQYGEFFLNVEVLEGAKACEKGKGDICSLKGETFGAKNPKWRWARESRAKKVVRNRTARLKDSAF